MQRHGTVVQNYTLSIVATIFILSTNPYNMIFKCTAFQNFDYDYVNVKGYLSVSISCPGF